MGELGWELYIPTEFSLGVFDEVWAAGQPVGLVPAGMHAMNSLRMEKAYRHWGDDIADEDTPLEAGLSWGVDWDKPGGFIGRDALLAQRDAGLTRRLVQFRLDDPEPLLYHDEPILRNGLLVGRITSGMYGHTVGAALGMSYLDATRHLTRVHSDLEGPRGRCNGERVPRHASYRPSTNRTPTSRSFRLIDRFRQSHPWTTVILITSPA
jgi:4-methylaminobutanoate oxidase (formaldehyde-forming)